MRLKKQYLAAAVTLGIMNWTTYSEAAFDENLNEYTLDAVVVEADATKDQFGNTITEQSYYRTGGDVKVITREEIEKRHYQDLTDAIKRIPGVTFQNPGYRGGEYGYAPYNNSLSINGDSRVVVLVDGRRVDNATSTRFGSSNASGTRTMVDLNQVVNINNVEKIEVIKGPGASVYGADATGGVINIITRKGADENQGTIDLSTGSWKKHNYNVTYSGSAGDDKSWKYFISLDREMSGDTKYKDGLTGGNYTYRGTEFKEEGANIRIDKDFSDTENLRIWYNHRNGKDGYPITAPDYRFWNETEWNRIIQDTEDGKFGNTTNPGYRNLFVLDALSGSYNAFRNNDIDITYTFDKENGMESFIRFYDQDHHYWGVDRYPDWVADDGSFVPFPGSPAWDDFINNYQFSKTGPTTLYNEKNQGLQLQYGKSIDNNDLLFGLTYDKAKTYTKSLNRKDNTWKTTHVERDSILGFVQDKIHLSDKWDITPAIRYSNYSTFDKTNDAGTVSQGNTSSIIFTPTINTQYAFDDTTSAYLGWASVYRPIKSADYGKDTPNGASLKDEEGDVWTFGVRKDIDDKTSVALHYDWTDMDNAITNYSVWSDVDKDFVNKNVNAQETKKSINLTMDHQFDDHWNLSLAYSHMKDEWKAKDGMQFDPDINLDDNSNVNTMINALRPANHYIANLSYENGKWYTGLLANYYTGMDTTAFTDKHFFVLDWNLNYEINDDTTAYVTITNLTNEAYENAYSAYNGIGAAPQPGRCYMVGMRYKF